MPRSRPRVYHGRGHRAWTVTDPDDVRWMLPRLGPQPFATMTQPVRLGDPAAAALPRTCVRCSENPSPTFVPFAEAAARLGSGWYYRELASNHEAMVTAPRARADLLLDVVQVSSLDRAAGA